MSNPLIAAVGEALYGSRWHSELARALGVTYRTVRRWEVGDSQVPAGVYAELLERVKIHAAALGPLVPRLERAAQGSASAVAGAGSS